MAQNGKPETVNTWLRTAATRAVTTAGGGCAMLFVVAADAATGDASPRLRAAAGFPSADATREAAQTIAGDISAAVASGEAADAPVSETLLRNGANVLTILPACFGDQVLGVLAVGSPADPEPAVVGALSELAETVGLQLDHARLESEVTSLRSAAFESDSVADAKSDELLKLSEALFAQDIELMRSNEKLGSIEKLKNDFIEKMSRELRTPLNSIIEATISVLAGENERLSENAKSSLRHALDEGTAFQRTLQNILDLWKIKQGELAVELQEVNFNEVVDEAIFSVQDTIDDKPIEIEKDFDPIPTFKADLAKTNQVLFLLLDNAAKFTAEGQVVIRAGIEDGHLRCEVRDSGIGICPDDQQFVFDEFFQVDALSSTRYRGAGLGLALVRDLLVLLEGEMSVQSEPGHGTTVTFRIPVTLI
jgi:signal transduction histidine kinase